MKLNPSRVLSVSLLAMTCSWSASHAASGTLAPVAAPSVNAAPLVHQDDDDLWMRVVQADSTITLESVSRSYIPTDGHGPVILLVSAIHIGDWAYYDRIQSLLDEVPVVLWEGVGGEFLTVDDPAMRKNADALRVRTLRRVRFIDTVSRLSGGGQPGSMKELRESVPPSMRPLIDRSSNDAWGRPVTIVQDGDQWAVVSLGADGKPGGEGLDADVYSDTHTSPPEPRTDGGLQVELASALGLTFQMDGVDYQRAHWRNSDLSVSELRRAFAGEDVAERDTPATAPKPGVASDRLSARERSDAASEGSDDANETGGDSGQTDALLKTLSGEGALARVMKFVVRFMGKTPKSRANAKVMLAEMLQHADKLVEVQQGAVSEMMDVIIHERNKRVLYDLDQIIENEPEVEDVAVYYGGGHLSAMAESLAERGYEPAGELWFPAISVDMDANGLDPKQIEQTRRMISMFIQASIPPEPAGN